MKKYLLPIIGVLLMVLVAGCASSDEMAVQQVVTDSEKAAENALNGQGDRNAVEQYFANPLESGNTDPWMAQRIMFDQVVGRYHYGQVKLSKFAINSVTLWPEVNEARVNYQVDVTIVQNLVPTTETVTQDLLLTKTTRGWLIMGSNGAETTTGDASFIGNLGGQ